MTDFFSDFTETVFFDEGPDVIVKMATAIVTSSINTTNVDPYRQGTEIRQLKHYDAGIAKIFSGEPGHRLSRLTFGDASNVDDASPWRFVDVDRFDSTLMISSSLTLSTLIGDNTLLANNHEPLNGAIEPLTIREVAGFFSTEWPVPSHSVKGHFGGGNADHDLSADKITNVFTIDTSRVMIPFLDEIKTFANIQIGTEFINEKTAHRPFSDVRYVRNVKTSDPFSSDLISALSPMTGSTDNYVGIDEQTMPAGGLQDGTDSIAFGGMTYL